MQRIHYLDGLRGLAALGVVFAHTDSFFAAATSASARFDTVNIFVSVYHFLFSGNFFVCIFFVLSGYVLLSEKLVNRENALQIAVVKRYFRLTPVILFSVLFVLLIQNTVGFFNNEASHLIGGYEWLDNVKPKQFSFNEALWQGLTVIFTGNSPQNGVLWTMRIELIGSLLLFAFASLFYRSALYCHLAIIMAIVLVIFAGTDGVYFSLFLIGSVMKRLERFSLPLIFILPALYLGSLRGWYPEVAVLNNFFNLHGTGDYTEAAIHAVAAILLLASLKRSQSLQGVLSSDFFVWLGKISFSLYLVHFTIFFSIGCFVMIYTSQYTTVQNAAIAGWLMTIAASLLVADLFTRLFERPSIIWSDKIACRILGIKQIKVEDARAHPPSSV